MSRIESLWPGSIATAHRRRQRRYGRVVHHHATTSGQGAATTSRWRSAALAALVAGACAGDGGGEARLIPPSDADFSTLEAPELAGECSAAEQCEITCHHTCRASDPPRPVTCPPEPTPRPERLVGADCVCGDSVCRWE